MEMHSNTSLLLANITGDAHFGCACFIKFMQRMFSIYIFSKSWHLVQGGKRQSWRSVGFLRALLRDVCWYQSGPEVYPTLVEFRPSCPIFLDREWRTVHQVWRCLASLYPTHYHLRSLLSCVCPSRHLVTTFLCNVRSQWGLWYTYFLFPLSFGWS